MTDFLKQALSQQIRRRTEEPEAADRLARQGSTPRVAVRPEKQTQKGAGPEPFRELGQRSAAVLRWEVPVRTPGETAVSPAESPAGTEELLAEPAMRGAEAALLRLERTRQAAQFAILERHGGVVTVTEPETAAGRQTDAELLDRAVERDARRYDGGFAFY